MSNQREIKFKIWDKRNKIEVMFAETEAEMKKRLDKEMRKFRKENKKATKEWREKDLVILVKDNELFIKRNALTGKTGQVYFRDICDEIKYATHEALDRAKLHYGKGEVVMVEGSEMYRTPENEGGDADFLMRYERKLVDYLEEFPNE